MSKTLIMYNYNFHGWPTGVKAKAFEEELFYTNGCGYPRRVQYMDGSVTEYVYTATGEKLRAVHRTAAHNVSVAFGQVKNLSASGDLCKTHGNFAEVST